MAELKKDNPTWFEGVCSYKTYQKCETNLVEVEGEPSLFDHLYVTRKFFYINNRFYEYFIPPPPPSPPN